MIIAIKIIFTEFDSPEVDIPEDMIELKCYCAHNSPLSAKEPLIKSGKW